MSAPAPKRQIFLSHASEDKPAVLKFAELLRSRPLALENQINVWVDKTHIREGDSYVNQFIETIDDPATCAFILFVPQEIKPWIKHEIKRARTRNTRNEVENNTLFPMFHVYPGPRNQQRIPPPEIADYTDKAYVYENEEAADEILTAIIETFPLVTIEPEARQPIPSPESGTSDSITHSSSKLATPEAEPPEELHHLYSLSCHNDIVICEDDTGRQTRCTKQALQTVRPSPETRHALHELFPLLINRKPADIVRIRLMTNDAELAMLPWSDLLDDYVVEISPPQVFYRPGFDRHSVSNPLVVIPAHPEHDIAAGQHYTLLQGYFREYLGLDAVLRITTAATLEHDIQFNPPDLIYIYASLSKQRIQLDANDINQSQHHYSSVSPDELGQWIAQTGTRPVLVANFVGEELQHWPLSLVQSCRMVWIQSSEGYRKLNQLTQRFLDKLEQLPQQTDLVKLINSDTTPVGSRSHLWLNGQSPQLSVTNTSSLSGQLRLALLKVMLGRDTLKQSMYGFINDRNNTHTVMAYAVTGCKTACPFDFPAQLQQRLEDWDARGEAGLPVIPYHFSFTISDGNPSANLIGRALDEGLLRYTYDPEEAFGRELKRRRLLNSYKCLMLNWHIRIQRGQEDSISDWLAMWGVTVHNELSGHIPAQSILLHGLCIEVAKQDDAQAVQNLANDTIDSLYQYQMGFIENNEALGTLPIREIRNFLTNPKWHQALKLDQSPIDPNAYAQWVHATANKGEFEKTVAILWQQYQNNYQDYLQA